MSRREFDSLFADSSDEEEDCLDFDKSSYFGESVLDDHGSEGGRDACASDESDGESEEGSDDSDNETVKPSDGGEDDEPNIMDVDSVGGARESRKDDMENGNDTKTSEREEEAENLHEEDFYNMDDDDIKSKDEKVNEDNANRSSQGPSTVEGGKVSLQVTVSQAVSELQRSLQRSDSCDTTRKETTDGGVVDRNDEKSKTIFTNVKGKLGYNQVPLWQPYNGQIAFKFDKCDPQITKSFIDTNIAKEVLKGGKFSTCYSATQMKLESAQFNSSRISLSTIQFGRYIRKGNNCRVRRATMSNRDYAVKMFRVNRVAPEDILKERDMLIYLKDRRFICDIVGAFHQGTAFTVMELCFGNVDSLLPHMPDQHKSRYCVQLLLGLEWLHSRSVIHTNINTKNCLINSLNNLVIADFKRAILLENESVIYSRAPRGLLHFQDLESNSELSYSTDSDVFSAGHVIYNIERGQHLTGDEVGKDKYIRIIRERFPWGTRPSYQLNLAEDIERIIPKIKQCAMQNVLMNMLSAKRERRISAADAVSRTTLNPPKGVDFKHLMNDTRGVKYEISYASETEWAYDSEEFELDPNKLQPHRAFSSFYFDERDTLYNDMTPLSSIRNPRLASRPDWRYRNLVGEWGRHPTSHTPSLPSTSVTVPSAATKTSVAVQTDMERMKLIDEIQLELTSEIQDEMTKVVRNIMSSPAVKGHLNKCIASAVGSRIDKIFELISPVSPVTKSPAACPPRTEKDGVDEKCPGKPAQQALSIYSIPTATASSSSAIPSPSSSQIPPIQQKKADQVKVDDDSLFKMPAPVSINRRTRLNRATATTNKAAPLQNPPINTEATKAAPLQNHPVPSHVSKAVSPQTVSTINQATKAASPQTVSTINQATKAALQKVPSVPTPMTKAVSPQTLSKLSLDKKAVLSKTPSTTSQATKAALSQTRPKLGQGTKVASQHAPPAPAQATKAASPQHPQIHTQTTKTVSPHIHSTINQATKAASQHTPPKPSRAAVPVSTHTPHTPKRTAAPIVLDMLPPGMPMCLTSSKTIKVANGGNGNGSPISVSPQQQRQNRQQMSSPAPKFGSHSLTEYRQAETFPSTNKTPEKIFEYPKRTSETSPTSSIHSKISHSVISPSSPSTEASSKPLSLKPRVLFAKNVTSASSTPLGHEPPIKTVKADERQEMEKNRARRGKAPYQPVSTSSTVDKVGPDCVAPTTAASTGIASASDKEAEAGDVEGKADVVVLRYKGLVDNLVDEKKKKERSPHRKKHSKSKRHSKQTTASTSSTQPSSIKPSSSHASTQSSFSQQVLSESKSHSKKRQLDESTGRDVDETKEREGCIESSKAKKKRLSVEPMHQYPSPEAKPDK